MSEPAPERKPVQIFVDAQRFKARGWGWEDVFHELKERGMTRGYAQLLILGKKKSREQD